MCTYFKKSSIMRVRVRELQDLKKNINEMKNRKKIEWKENWNRLSEISFRFFNIDMSTKRCDGVARRKI